MKYVNFNVVQLLKDYEKNRNKAITTAHSVKFLTKMSNNPKNPQLVKNQVGQGEVDSMLHACELELAQLQWYCDLVEMGLGALSEIERDVLTLWLWDNEPPEKIIGELGIQSGTELVKIKRMALEHFDQTINPR